MQIDHVVVLMLENHSFDRMLGWMPGVDGVDTTHPRSNPNLARTAVAQTTTVTRQMKSDPAHDLSDVMAQMAGPNMGFVTNFQRHYPKSVAADWNEVMNYYGQGTLPVLHALAQAFVFATGGSARCRGRRGRTASSCIAGLRWGMSICRRGSFIRICTCTTRRRCTTNCSARGRAGRSTAATSRKP